MLKHEGCNSEAHLGMLDYEVPHEFRTEFERHVFQSGVIFLFPKLTIEAEHAKVPQTNLIDFPEYSIRYFSVDGNGVRFRPDLSTRRQPSL